MVDGDDWREHRLLIMSEIRSLREDVKDVKASVIMLRETDLSRVRIDIAMLQVKSGLWGAGAGALIALIPVLVKLAG
jgi:hypothetical protein